MLRPRTVLLDTDFFVLMAGADLMAPLLEALDCEPGTARRLAPLPHMLESGRLARRYPAEVLERASVWCETIGAIENSPAVELQESFLEVVDPGEALLLATAVDLDEGIVATGDKRACVAVATAPSLSAVRPHLAGKLLCLEFALDLLRDSVGFDALAEALIPVRDYNRTLRLLLPEAGATSEQHFREGLASYLGNLQDEAGALLLRRG